MPFAFNILFFSFFFFFVASLFHFFLLSIYTQAFSVIQLILAIHIIVLLTLSCIAYYDDYGIYYGYLWWIMHKNKIQVDLSKTLNGDDTTYFWFFWEITLIFSVWDIIIIKGVTFGELTFIRGLTYYQLSFLCWWHIFELIFISTSIAGRILHWDHCMEHLSSCERQFEYQFNFLSSAC